MIRSLYETMKRPFIIDYGVGNIGSLQNMYRCVSGVIPILTSDLTEIESGDYNYFRPFWWDLPLVGKLRR